MLMSTELEVSVLAARQGLAAPRSIPTLAVQPVRRPEEPHLAAVALPTPQRLRAVRRVEPRPLNAPARKRRQMMSNPTGACVAPHHLVAAGTAASGWRSVVAAALGYPARLARRAKAKLGVLPAVVRSCRSPSFRLAPERQRQYHLISSYSSNVRNFFGTLSYKSVSLKVRYLRRKCPTLNKQSYFNARSDCRSSADACCRQAVRRISLSLSAQSRGQPLPLPRVHSEPPG